MSEYKMSFIISTKNRLPFLKILFEQLLPQMKPDEEIVVVDGNSTDGSKEFLKGLLASNKIHQFTSAPDKNQAHGWNKAMLMAKGLIIKKLIDDDVHNFIAIRKCGDFMMANPHIDLCISNNLESNLADPGKVGVAGRLPYFLQWKGGQVKTLTFSDVSMLIRRSSLSFLGLYDTQFKMMDWEYSLRVSYLQAKIAYYTGCNSLAVGTPGNVTSTATKELFLFEESIGKIKYGYQGDRFDITFYSKIKIRLGKIRYKLFNRKDAPEIPISIPPENQLMQIYALYYQQLDDYNKAGQFDFIS